MFNRYNKVEELIEDSEKRIAELEEAYNDPEISSDYARLSEICADIEALRAEVDALMEEWESLQLKIDKGL